MKIIIRILILGIILSSCVGKNQSKSTGQTSPVVAGTWKLISGTTIEKGDTTVTYYSKNLSFIKIINDSHFAFLEHDLTKGKDSAAIYVSGGGRYSINGNSYTEHLEYCSDRQWEGNDFNFTISVKNDTLVQTGIEKVEDAGINRLNIEKYVRLKN